MNIRNAVLRGFNTASIVLMVAGVGYTIDCRLNGWQEPGSCWSAGILGAVGGAGVRMGIGEKPTHPANAPIAEVRARVAARRRGRQEARDGSE